MRKLQPQPPKNAAKDFIKSLPYLVWFCGFFAYLFVMVLVASATLEADPEGPSSMIVFAFFAIPLIWALFARLGD